MRRSAFFQSWGPGLLPVVGLLMAALPLAGQNNPGPLRRPQFGVGFVANAPDAVLGGGVYVVLPTVGPITGGLGLYVDAKFDLENASDERAFNPDVTPSEILNDPNRDRADFIKTESSWWSLNAAVVRPLTPFLMAYAGGGVARKTDYALFNVDQDDPVGVGGLVWAEDPEGEETRANLMAGIIMRLTSSVSTHFGFETQPRGFTVGASLRLPRW